MSIAFDPPETDPVAGPELQQEIQDRQAADELLIPLEQKGAPNGVAVLGSDGKIVDSQLGQLAITDVFPVASQSAMLALTAERGDVAIRSDLNKSFILSASPASTLANWKEMLTPTDVVTSINGRQGVVTGLAEQSALTTEIARAQGAEQTAVDLADTKVPKSDIDTDSTFAANSDTKVPSQKAVKAALAAIDLTSLVTLSPATAARNTVQPSADVVPLTVKGKASQSANLQEWRDSAGTLLAYVSAGGVPYAPYGLVTGNLVTAAVADSTQFGPQITLSSTAAKVTNRNTASNVVLTVKGMASQTGNLQEWQSSAAAVYSTISENGYFTTRKVAAPADAELATSEVAFWFDDTSGAAKLKIKGKDSGGVVRTGEVALT